MEYSNERTCFTDDIARPSALKPLLSCCCSAVAVQKKSKALCPDLSRMQHVSTKMQNHTLHATKERDVSWPQIVTLYKVTFWSRWVVPVFQAKTTGPPPTLSCRLIRTFIPRRTRNHHRGNKLSHLYLFLSIYIPTHVYTKMLMRLKQTNIWG